MARSASRVEVASRSCDLRWDADVSQRGDRDVAWLLVVVAVTATVVFVALAIAVTGSSSLGLDSRASTVVIPTEPSPARTRPEPRSRPSSTVPIKAVTTTSSTTIDSRSPPSPISPREFASSLTHAPDHICDPRVLPRVRGTEASQDPPPGSNPSGGRFRCETPPFVKWITFPLCAWGRDTATACLVGWAVA